MASIQSILRENYVNGNACPHTHVSLISPKGKFLFNRENLEVFWSQYCDALVSPHPVTLGIAEKTQHYMPVIVDVDIKVLMTDENRYIIGARGKHIYSEEQLEDTVSVYQGVLRKIVKGCNDMHLTCVILEKTPYRTDKAAKSYIKNGFHLHFPYLFLNKYDQETHLITRVKEMLKDLEVFKSIGYENSGDVIDSAIDTVPWLLYGSSKAADMEAYKVTRVVDSSVNNVDIETAFANYKLYDKDENEIDIKGRVEYYLPRILSVVIYNRDFQELKTGLQMVGKKASSQKNKNNTERRVTLRGETHEKIMKMTTRLVNMLSDHRADDMMEWLKIGWVLYNIGNGSDEALNIWLDFSARCEEKYDESTCVYHWNRMSVRSYTIGTLKYYAHMDNPEAYTEFIQEESQDHIQRSLDGGHHDIAKILYAKYSTEFVCGSYANRTWYRFVNHKWEEIEEGVDMVNIISEDLPHEFEKESRRLGIEIASTTDKSQAASVMSKQKSVLKTMVNLKSTPFVSNILKASSAIFYDKRFKEKLNQDPYLIAFENGVYDLKQNIFRDGIPEDFISEAMPIKYNGTYSESHEDVLDVIDFFVKVFPDKDVREYFLHIYSDLFVGGNPEKIVLFWTGNGDNGKSVTQRLFEKMLGKLSIKFETTLFTGKKTQTGSANPDLARAVPPVRLATMEEPDNDEQMNIGYLKKLSGDDTFWARDLFEKGKNVREVEVMFMITVIANKLPALKHADAATFNRIRVIPFESKFCKPGDACPDTLEEQIKQKRFPRDNKFRDKVPKMIPALAWYLLHWRKNYRPSVITEPIKVLEATSQYQKQNDTFREFMDEMIISQKGSRMSTSEVYNEFKFWFRDSYANQTLPVKREVVNYFTDAWGAPTAGYWPDIASASSNGDKSNNENNTEIVDMDNERCDGNVDREDKLIDSDDGE